MTAPPPAPLERARAAKERLSEQLTGLPELRGIGIAILDGGFGVKVNLLRAVGEDVVPGEVDGVPVIVDVVGPIVAL